MSKKIYSQRNIPFSWEKTNSGESKPPKNHHHEPPIKLPPPPCPPPENCRASFHDIQIPLPPCAFHQPLPRPPSRNSSKRGLKRIDDDPFLIAYKEVTKTNSTKKEGNNNNYYSNKKDHQVGINGLIKNMSIFSCKQSSCVVTDESIVKMVQLPFSRSSHKD